MYDVVVIGAGPGGSFAAKLLAAAGYDVVLIERERIPRDKPCAGWITPNVLKLLNFSPSKFECLQPIPGAVLWITTKDKLTPYVVKYRRPLSYGIRRIEFDTAISNDAKDAGAEVLDSTFVTHVYRQKKAVFIQAKDNQEFKARFVIGADGPHSTVAKSLWLRRNWEPSELVQCVVSETEIGSKGNELTKYFGFAELFLNVDTMSYSWYFTKKNFLNIGLGIQMSKISPTCNSKTLYRDHIAKLNQLNHLQDVQLAPIKAATYPAYYGPYHYPTYGDRVILVGDAGGFPINYTGEGIRTALLTGKFAAETLISALEEDQKDLTAYYARWSRALRDEYLLGDILQMMFTPSYYDMIKSLFLEERRFRRLFFDLFFCRTTPREALRRLLLYSPILAQRFLRYTGFSLLKDLLNFFNV